MRIVVIALAALMLSPAPRAQSPRFGESNRLGISNGEGSYYAAVTRFNGKNSFIQLSKLSTVDYKIVWNAVHDVGKDERVHALHLDADENVFVAGSRKTGDHWEILIAKYDGSGKFKWDIKIDSEREAVPSAIVVAKDGTIYVGATAMGEKHYTARVYKLWNVGFVDWHRDYWSFWRR